MPRSGCQLGVRDPQPLLLLPLLARAHRHNAILRTISVDTSDVLADESRLAPRAVRVGARETFWIDSDSRLARQILGVQSVDPFLGSFTVWFDPASLSQRR